MKRVLVIGEHSYIGTSFRDYMKKYAPDVTVTLIGARNKNFATVDFSQYDTVLHVAAIVHKKERPDMQQAYQKVNTEFPVELAKKAKKSGVKQFVFLSTMAVYGKVFSPIVSNTKKIPVTMYGKSKLAAEQELAAIADEQFSVVVLRPPMVYGAKCPGNYKRLAKLAYKLPIFVNVNNKRSMIYIENLCECIRQEMVKDKKRYQIVCPQNLEYVNTTELVREIRKAHGKRTLILPFPQILIRLCVAKIPTVEKVFGDCFYEKDKECLKYQISDFVTSIHKTEKED